MVLREKAFRSVGWREGTKQRLCSRFLAVRVRPAHRDYWRSEPHAEHWLVVEWPRGAAGPTECKRQTNPSCAGARRVVS